MKFWLRDYSSRHVVRRGKILISGAEHVMFETVRGIDSLTCPVSIDELLIQDTEECPMERPDEHIYDRLQCVQK